MLDDTAHLRFCAEMLVAGSKSSHICASQEFLLRPNFVLIQLVSLVLFHGEPNCSVYIPFIFNSSRIKRSVRPFEEKEILQDLRAQQV